MKTFLRFFTLGVFACISMSFAISQTVFVVEPDQGISTNALVDAVTANGDGIYELKRGGEYFIEGRFTVENEITIRAEEGTGARPKIIAISDELGELPSDLFRFNKSVTIQNVYVTGRDIVTGKNVQRIFRMNGADIVFKIENSLVEHVYNFCIRNDNTGNRLYIDNSSFRNLSLTSDPANGRLMDTRGNALKVISFTNSSIYNITGNLIRFDDAITEKVVITDNTFYNVGYHMRINYAMDVTIQNNIFANVGWKATYGETATPGGFFELREFIESDTYKHADVKMKVTNNNIYTSPEVKALFTKYPLSYERTLTDSTFNAYIEKGQIEFTNNIEEVLTFEKPSPLPIIYIDKFFEMNGTGMAEHADLPFNVDEDNNPDTMDPGANEYSFRYQLATTSASASTTGGPIGAPRWYPIGTGITQQGIDNLKLYPGLVKDVLNLNLGEDIIRSAEITIYNVLGSTVYTNSLTSAETQINLSQLKSGIYTYTIQLDSKQQSGKFIKQ